MTTSTTVGFAQELRKNMPINMIRNFFFIKNILMLKDYNEKFKNSNNQKKLKL
jgi:hypothetical protein